MQLFVRGQQNHTLEVIGNESVYALKVSRYQSHLLFEDALS